MARFLERRYGKNVFGEPILYPSDQELVIRVDGEEKVPRKTKKARNKVVKANPHLDNDPLFKYEETIHGSSNSPEILVGKQSFYGAYISYIFHRNHAKRGIITPKEQRRMPPFHVTPGALVLVVHDEQGKEYFVVGEKPNGSQTLIGGTLDPTKDIAENRANSSKKKSSKKKDIKFLSVAKSVQREAEEEVGVVIPGNLKPKAIFDLRFGRQIVYMHDTGMTKEQMEEAFRSRSDRELSGIKFVEATPEGIENYTQKNPKGLGAIPKILGHMVVRRKIDRIRAMEPDRGVTEYNPAIHLSGKRGSKEGIVSPVEPTYQLKVPDDYQRIIDTSNRIIEANSRDQRVQD